MTAKHQDWLAANVLSDEKHVTYRVLSHALEVHSNVAKQMLFEFHKTQNARKQSSVHATYLIAGIRKPSAGGINGHGGNDTAMGDGSFMNSSMPESEAVEPEDIKVTTVALVKEKNLEKAKSQYESISTIYIYALSPGDIADFQVLTECNKRVHAESIGVDALEAWKTFGTIHNPLAKRRTTRIPVAALPATAASSKATAATSSPAPPSSKSSQSTSQTTPSTKRPPTTKRESSSLFKSFGKTAASNAKLKLNTPADGTSDEEKDADAMEEDAPNAEEQAKQQAKAEAAAKEKAAKDAKLRAMMEAEEEEEEEPEEREEERDDEDEEMAEAWSESEPETSAAAATEPQQQEQNVTMADGRRRGRRRVMRKKTTTDEEGFLVTREEPAWESFSEDEAPSSKLAPSSGSQGKATPQSSAKSDATAAGKKSGAASKKGQGNIMNFFKK